VAAIQPGRWYYRCGAMLLELPTDDQERASRWRAVEPCQRPPVGAVLAALASQPDCPLVPTDLQRLEGLMHGTRWI
jgi:hypothetical protein